MIVVEPVDEPKQEPKKKRTGDPTLALCNRIDRALAALPDWGIDMVLRFLCKKHGVKVQ